MIPVDLSCNAGFPYEGAATLLSVLAWPEEVLETARMANHHTRVCQLLLTAQAAVDSEWADMRHLIKPKHFLCSPQSLATAERNLRRRLQVRSAAARMVIPFLRELLDVPPGLPKSVRRLSLNAVSDLVLSDVGENEPANVEQRVWRSSIPVIHIATALVVVAEGAEWAGQINAVGELYQSPHLLEEVVVTSNAYADVMPMIGRFTIPPERLIRLSLP